MKKIIRNLIYTLHLSELAYKIECMRKHKLSSTCFKTEDDALIFLQSVSPNLGQSCITYRKFLQKDCDVEVIVPCYNVEKYIEECIESILAQKTKYNFCITIINDGSIDSTREVLRKYENINNVRIIDQNNKGFSGARNSGISQAHGRYLLFVDADDVLLPGTIDGLMSLAEKYNADVVDSGYIRFADRTKKSFKSIIRASFYDFCQKPQGISSNRISGYPWGKLWKTQLFKNVQFPQGYWFEDTIVWMILEPLCKVKVLSHLLTTRYRMNPDSISHVASKYTKSIDTLYITLRLLEDRRKLGIHFNQQQYENLLQQMRTNFNRVSTLDSKIKQAVFVVQQRLISETFSSWSTNNAKVKPIQELLRSNDYIGFDLWCKWH